MIRRTRVSFVKLFIFFYVYILICSKRTDTWEKTIPDTIAYVINSVIYASANLYGE